MNAADTTGPDARGPVPKKPNDLRIIRRDLPRDFVDFDGLKVLRRLTRFGFKAYLVGGGVRDFLLGEVPKDFDVVTDARPREVRRIFRNCRLIGRRFRLAHVHFQGKIIEVSTFRRNPDAELVRELQANGQTDADENGQLEPGDLLIREDNVFGTEEEDARRRDFTCNALFYDLERGAILDYVGGVADTEARLIRTIGPPAIRCAEDPVRILRAIKFAARLRLRIDDPTWEAMTKLSPEIAQCAAPRVLEEVLRMLRSRNAATAYQLLHEVGALSTLLPELEFGPPGTGDNGTNEHVAMLRALDDVQERRAEPLNDPVLVAALFWPEIQRRFELMRDVPGNGRARDFGAIIADTLRDPALRLRMPRRLIGRTTLILLAQGKLGVGRRRRLRPEALVRREFFQDALTLFEIRTRTLNRGWELLTLWRRLTHTPGDREVIQAILRTPGVDADESRPEGGPAPQRRGRRGGRRRRRRRKQEPPSAATPTPPPSGPTASTRPEARQAVACEE